jgi:chemotaxis protein CheD
MIGTDTFISTTLLPGEIALGTRGDRLETLLGSCVAIVLTDPRRTVGAMCHIVHTKAPVGHEARDGAYAEVALHTMAEQLRARGIVPALCEAYVYGGGDMFPQLEPRLSVGYDNADWALKALAAMGIKVLAIDLGGCVYRKLSWVVGPQAPEVRAMAVEART